MSTSSAPIKTLWFEFLLNPNLLEQHLSSDYSDPTPIELIIQFMNNATASSSQNGTPVLIEEQQVNGQPPSLVVHSPTGPVPGAVEESRRVPEEVENKKSAALKLLAVKVASHLKWNLEVLEKQLPLTLQFSLLNELIRCGEKGQPGNCGIFPYITYYRWILRAIMRVSYPVRGQKGFTVSIPLLQQIDPCFVPHEMMETLVKKLHDLAPAAVAGLEKIVSENSVKQTIKIWMPLVSCFNVMPGESDFDWSRADQLEASQVVDTLKYELGKWFFFNENYIRSNEYFETISRRKRKLFSHLEDYLTATREMIEPGAATDVEIMDSRTYFADCLEQVMAGNSCDVSIIERRVDIEIIAKEINKAFKATSDLKKHSLLKKFGFYISSKISGLKELLVIFADNEPTSCAETDNNGHTSLNTVEEGEIDMEEELVKDTELLLLEATDPEVIQNLATKVEKHPMAINRRWEIPRAHAQCLQNLASSQYQKCHIVLAKADELRKARLYIESRTLYLSLLEDIQISLPALADLIRFELLQTDLEYHFETNDVDERRVIDMLKNCERVLRNEQIVSELSPQLIDLCCAFTLDSSSSLLKEFLNSPHPVIRLSCSLYCLTQDTNGINPKCKDLWDLIMTAFVPIPMSRRAQPLPPGLTVSTFLSFIRKLKSTQTSHVIASCLMKMYNMVRDNPTMELTVAELPSIQWPPSLGSHAGDVSINSISMVLHTFLERALLQQPNEVTWIKCKAELSLIEEHFAQALKYYISMLIITTEYFTAFANSSEEDLTIQRMVQCSTRLGCHTQAAVFHQMSQEPNYALAFKSLSERNCNDSCDDLYDCIWDINLLEYLVNLHTRRGEIDRKLKAVHLIGQLELNANNSEGILREAANVRRGRFFRILAKKYL